PTTLALTRQNLPTLRTEHEADNMCAYGAYEIAGGHNAEISIFASGSEVEIALEARKLLAAEGHSVRVISVPCMELFEQQTAGYQQAIIGTSPVRIAVEAGIRQGWDRFIGSDGIFIGMNSFGASGPYKDLYRHFGITAEAVAAAARDKLNRGEGSASIAR